MPPALKTTKDISEALEATGLLDEVENPRFSDEDNRYGRWHEPDDSDDKDALPREYMKDNPPPENTAEEEEEQEEEEQEEEEQEEEEQEEEEQEEEEQEEEEQEEEAESEDKPEEESEEESLPPLETVAELSEALDTTPEEFLATIKHTVTTPDGEKEITLSELAKSYMREGDYTKKTQEVSTQRDQLEQARQAQIQEFQKGASELASTMDHVVGLLHGELESPDLLRLKAGDSDERVTAMEQETAIQKQIADMGNVRAEAGARYDQFMGAQKEAFAHEQLQILQRDIEGFDQGNLETAVRAFHEMGFQNHELQHLMDARLIKTALLMNHLQSKNTELQAIVDKGEKDVKKIKKRVPKLTKPGKNGKSTQKKLTKLEQAAARLKQSTEKRRGKTNTHDLADVLEAGGLK